MKIVILMLILFGWGFAVGYGVHPYIGNNNSIISLEECIKYAHDGALIHGIIAKRGEDVEHNLCWQNIHRSTALWLEELQTVLKK